MYVTIDPKELAAFFQVRGFFPAVPRGWKELACVKPFERYNLVIVIGTSVDRRGQRGYGKDAIRCLLMTISDGRVRWQLTPTKRTEHWASNLSRKIAILEGLMATAQPCSGCGGAMVPRQGSGGAFWGCARFPECRATHRIPAPLQYRLLADTVEVKRVKG